MVKLYHQGEEIDLAEASWIFDAIAQMYRDEMGELLNTALAGDEAAIAKLFTDTEIKVIK